MKRFKCYFIGRKKLKEHNATEVCGYLSAPEALALSDAGWVVLGWPGRVEYFIAKTKIGDCTRQWVYFKKPKGWVEYNA